MASLTGTKIKDTYDGLLKTTDNGALGASEKLITDGLGNSSGVYLGTSGDVGIGASNPLAKTHIKSGSSGFSGTLNTNYDDLAVEGSGNTGITILSPNNQNTGIAFADSDATAQGLVLYSHIDDYMAFRTSATERMRIDTSGYLRLAGAGIQFNGDTAAANSLDDYEEGEFTPVVADAETGGNVAAGGTFTGVYTKIGRQVTVVMQNSNINTTGMTSGNDLWIRNLPFTSGGFTGSPLWIGATRVSAITASANSLGFQTMMAENSSAVRIIEMINILNSAPILVSSINSGASDIWVTLTYFV